MREKWLIITVAVFQFCRQLISVFSPNASEYDLPRSDRKKLFMVRVAFVLVAAAGALYTLPEWLPDCLVWDDLSDDGKYQTLKGALKTMGVLFASHSLGDVAGNQLCTRMLRAQAVNAKKLR